MTDEEIALLDALVSKANAVSDGHVTVFKFTTNWRVLFGTPFERKGIEGAPVGKTFAEAAKAALWKQENKNRPSTKQ